MCACVTVRRIKKALQKFLEVLLGKNCNDINSSGENFLNPKNTASAGEYSRERQD